MTWELKDAWHENFEKLSWLKLAEKASFHLNISSTKKKLEMCKLFRSNRWKLCLWLLFYLVWWQRFLISKQPFRWLLLKYLEYWHQISAQKLEKYDKTFGIKISVGLGDVVVDHVRHLQAAFQNVCIIQYIWAQIIQR